MGLIGILYTSYIFFFRGSLIVSEKSPCGDDYHLYAYLEPMWFAMPGGGGMGSKSVKIQVRNRWGFLVGETNKDCYTFYDSLKISWDCKAHLLNFSVARTIDLKTGECGY